MIARIKAGILVGIFFGGMFCWGKIIALVGDYFNLSMITQILILTTFMLIMGKLINKCPEQ